jgi:transcriptional regulator with XRE-family HTH domain
LPKLGEVSEHERIRRRRGLSVTVMAALTGVSHAYVSQIETGRARASAKYRAAAAAALGVPENVLFPENGR